MNSDKKMNKELTVSSAVEVDKERIISPAVKYIGETGEGYTVSMEMMGVDWEHAFKIAADWAEPITPVQNGFMTSKKRWVDIYEARYIVEKSRLAPFDHPNFPGLTVEDWIAGLAHIPLKDQNKD